MTVKIHGKEYKTVAERINEFHKDHVDFSITTELVSDLNNIVIMKATVEVKGATATGYAEEVRGSTSINKTSALENCETSAIGRALAFFGYAGTEIASADEVANAISRTGATAFVSKPQTITITEVIEIEKLAELKGATVSNILTAYKIKALNELTGVQASAVMTKLGQQ
jgi:hypothetical protein